jgi:hypothetical protein
MLFVAGLGPPVARLQGAMPRLTIPFGNPLWSQAGIIVDWSGLESVPITLRMVG